MPASSGQGGMPIPVKNSHRKMEAYQPKASSDMAVPRPGPAPGGAPGDSRPFLIEGQILCQTCASARAYGATPGSRTQRHLMVIQRPLTHEADAVRPDAVQDEFRVIDPAQVLPQQRVGVPDLLENHRVCDHFRDAR